MIETLDPYSRFYGADEVAQLRRETSGHYTGIGVVFATPLSDARVLFTLPQSPARKAGLRVGDQLLRVAGKNVGDMTPSELRAILGQPDREPVEVAVLGRDQVERSTQIGSDALIDPSVRHARIVDAQLGVGYLAILSFSQETADEFDSAVRDLKSQGMKALIVDLRGNLGGVLRTAVRIANRFIPNGVIVSHEGRAETIRYSAEEKLATLAGLPLVLLVDGESASASEVLAAAIQEHRAGVVIGTPTYGKGMVQQVRTFGDGDMVVKLITSYYYTPSHRNIERTVDGAWAKGLLPDIEMTLTPTEVEAIRAYRASYSPPEDSRDAIADWEREEGRRLSPATPPDAHIDAAIALFAGRRPGAYAVAVKP